MRSIVGVLAASLFASAPAYACSCVLGQNAADVVAEQAAGDEELRVFSARMVGTIETRFGRWAVLEVDRVWAGSPLRHTLLSLKASTCGVPDLVHEPERIFVSYRREGFLRNWTTDNCFDNETLSGASATLARLGPGQRPTSELTIVSLVLAAIGALFAGREVRRRRSGSP